MRPTDHYDPADIIKRLEAAEGPDPELDRVVAEAVGMETRELREGVFFARWPGDQHMSKHRFTASLDAAIALVERALPEDYTIIQRRQSGEYDCVIKTYDGAPVAEAYDAVSQPIALLIALFKALEAKDG